MKKQIALALISAVTLTLCACSRDHIQDVGDYEYNPETTASQSETQDESASAATDSAKGFTVDDRWHKNYRVSYRYYNPENDASTVTVKEAGTDKCFAVEYSEAGAVMVYRANGAGTDMYTISGSEKTHAFLSGKSFSSLSSLFMKLSAVDESMPMQSNVMYMGEETVAGRNCYKYIQRAYTDGEVTQTVYVWIDAEFGFSAKCQALDASGTLTLSWEVLTFESGSVTDGDVGPDLSGYEFTEVSE